MTCPCGEYDYVDSTNQTLSEAMACKCVCVFDLVCSPHPVIDHRERGNQVIHQYLTGSPLNPNATEYASVAASHSDRVHACVLRRFRHKWAILMRLYQHSAHCPVALRTFLDCNPMYWCFIPIPWDQSPTRDVPHPTNNRQPLRTVDRAQVMRYLRHVPGPPTAHFFSQRQRQMQHSFFEYFLSLDNEQSPYRALDLFRVKIIVVRKCSSDFYSTSQADFTVSLHSSTGRSFDHATLFDRDDVCHSRRNEIEHDLSDRWRSEETLWPPLSTALVQRSL